MDDGNAGAGESFDGLHGPDHIRIELFPIRCRGLRVDFHLMAGHWVVRALPKDADAVEKALLAGVACLKKAAIRYRNNFPDDQVASPLTGVRWVRRERP